MIIQHNPPLHLTYCLNIHPGESWAESFAAIEEPDREAIALARLGGYSVAEIARVLELSRAEVKRRMSRGLRSVAAELLPNPQPEPV